MEKLFGQETIVRFYTIIVQIISLKMIQMTLSTFAIKLFPIIKFSAHHFFFIFDNKKLKIIKITLTKKGLLVVIITMSSVVSDIINEF